ncbi:MAG: M18 family aminopeptidase [Cellulosilyticum sp.]|nr:M18 family aminopeptidase [Cellulosilyticum sp.]
MNTELTHKLLDFIDESPTMFHATTACIKRLESASFSFLNPSAAWELQVGGKYYTTINDSAIIAFCINADDVEQEGFKIIGTHDDVPGFRIKPNAQMQTENYIKLNTEGYGGAILSTWFDRPLSIAGRVALKSDNLLRPRTELVDVNKPILIIPSLAIHMNREVNNGVKMNKQKDTLPVLTYTNEPVKENLILELLADTLKVSVEDILDADLYLYPYEKSMLVGLKEEFISAPRLDDLSMTYAGLEAILNNTSKKGISMFVCYDNEEIGSHTKQGADSPYLIRTIERILLAMGKSREALFMALENSFMLSGDVAHLSHPNYMEKSDPTNPVLPGKGPAIKVNANFSYTTDSDSYAVFAGICKANNIPFQVFVNRSDERGGSTIGPVAASHLGIRSVDIGTPMLSMHSARELMAADDFIYTTEAMKAFFSI